ncbi:MAG: iron ABC transporter permease [Halomonas sp.]|nr:iron ABC transporter permease [Halomonas sp.]MDN6297189.1 iron ABC transporter permease [Halomonas sp.]MDN6314309.1 iron ABC transporter permease [Halomonas sp.]MDN6335923.1 iron ABC transporter permease [Halomonas sp.]
MHARAHISRRALAALALVSAATLVLSTTVGPMSIMWQDSLRVLLGLGSAGGGAHLDTIITSIRLPRAILGMLVGAALAASGAAIQGLFRNPLADPGLIGVSGGAALAAVSVIVLGGTTLGPLIAWMGPYSLMLAAFAGGFVTTLLVARIATSRSGGTSTSTLLLGGIAINIITGSGVGLFTYMADDAQLRTLTFWSMGSLGGAMWEVVLAAGSLIVLALVLLPRLARPLNALLLGESEARHLGIDVNRVKYRVMLLSALAVGAAVAAAGMVGFVGLIVPHLVRMTLGPDHRYLLPASALLGGLFLVVADMLARSLIAPAELPIGLLTSMIGGPFFIALILVQGRKYRL